MIHSKCKQQYFNDDDDDNPSIIIQSKSYKRWTKQWMFNHVGKKKWCRNWILLSMLIVVWFDLFEYVLWYSIERLINLQFNNKRQPIVCVCLCILYKQRIISHQIFFLLFLFVLLQNECGRLACKQIKQNR